MTMTTDNHHTFMITIRVCTNGEIVHHAECCPCVSDGLSDEVIQIVSQPMTLYESVSAFASALLVALCADTNKPIPKITVNGEDLNAYNPRIN